MTGIAGHKAQPSLFLEQPEHQLQVAGYHRLQHHKGAHDGVQLPFPGQHADAFPDQGVGPEVPLGLGTHAVCVHSRISGKDTAAEHMEIRGGEGNMVCVLCLLQDDLSGELHILQGIYGPGLREDLFLGDTLSQKIVLNGFALGHAFIRALTAGGDEIRLLSGLLQLLPIEADGAVCTSLQQRIQSSVLADPTAEDDQEVLIIRRIMPSCPLTMQQGREQVADEVEEQRGDDTPRDGDGRL